MPLKKQNYTDEEIPIFDEASIYKRGAYWHFRMWLNNERKYARKSLRTHSKTTAIKKGKEAYLEIFANRKMGKTYFSLTTKEGVNNYLEHRKKDVESGLILKGPSFLSIPQALFYEINKNIWLMNGSLNLQGSESQGGCHQGL